jgi:hypothetical protein
VLSFALSEVTGRYVHLRVEKAGSRLDNADRLVVNGHSNLDVLAVLQHGHKLQAQVTRVQVRGEGVGHRLLRTSRDLDCVLLRSQIADDARLSSDLLEQRSANTGDENGRRLVVVDGEAGFGGMTVDELDAEDLRLRERDGDLDVDVWRLWLVGYLFDLLTRSVTDVMPHM